MTTRFTKQKLDIRETLHDLNSAKGSAGLALLKSDTHEEQQALLGVGRRNTVINGNFDIWQRATSHTYGTVTAYSYDSADRWGFKTTGTSCVVAREAITPGPHPDSVPNASYYMSISNIQSGEGASQYVHIDHRIENLKRFSGQWVTLSFWARASADMTLGLELVSFYDSSGESNGFTYRDYNLGTKITTYWKKYTHTVRVEDGTYKTYGADSQLVIRFAPSSGTDFNTRWNGPDGVAINFEGTVDIAQVQLELGKVATPFEQRSYSEELALCQRYYFRVDEPGGKDGVVGVASAYNSDTANFGFINPVQMRSDDGTVTFNSVRIRTAVGSSQTATMSQQAARKGYTEVNLTIGSTSFNPGDALQVRIDYTGYIAVDHEL